jgi:hypothetical protein
MEKPDYVRLAAGLPEDLLDSFADLVGAPWRSGEAGRGMPNKCSDLRRRPGTVLIVAILKASRDSRAASPLSWRRSGVVSRSSQHRAGLPTTTVSGSTLRMTTIDPGLPLTDDDVLQRAGMRPEPGVGPTTRSSSSGTP